MNDSISKVIVDGMKNLLPGMLLVCTSFNGYKFRYLRARRRWDHPSSPLLAIAIRSNEPNLHEGRNTA